MQTKAFFTTVVLSAAVGAASVLLMPKDSKVYRAAEDVAESLKAEAGRMMDSMKQ